MLNLEKIAAFAAEKHGDQKWGCYDYSAHLFACARMAESYGYDEEIQAACLLHDILEDTDCTVQQLLNVGATPRVMDLVYAVTDEPGATRKERKLRTYPKIVKTPDAIVVKLIDRVVNVMHCIVAHRGFHKMYKDEHTEFLDNLIPAPAESHGRKMELWSIYMKLMEIPLK